MLVAGILLEARLLLDEQLTALLSSIPGQQDMEEVWLLVVVEMVLLAEVRISLFTPSTILSPLHILPARTPVGPSWSPALRHP